jgi:polar amino acid transport system substrate-binding protein
MRRRDFLISTGKCAVILGAVMASPLVSPAKADTLDEIKSRGKMIVAIDPTFAPFEYTDSSGKIVGYDPEILESIAADWGVKIEYQVMAFSGIIPGLIAGSFDFSGSALNITAERAKKIGFTIPVAASVNAVLKLKGNDKLKSSKIDDLSGHKCAVKQTTAPEQMMQAFNEKLKGESKPAVELLSFETVEQTVAALADGRVDCVVDDKVVLYQAMSQRKDVAMEVVGEIGGKALVGWGTNKGDPKLTAALDDTIKKLKASGKLAELQKKNFGYVMEDLPEENFIPAQ